MNDLLFKLPLLFIPKREIMHPTTDKGVSKKILVQFLKQYKYMGLMHMILHGKVNEMLGSSNIESMGDMLKMADENMECKDTYLKAAIGHMRLPQNLDGKISPAHVAKIYKDWEQYINENLDKICDNYESHKSFKSLLKEKRKRRRKELVCIH